MARVLGLLLSSASLTHALTVRAPTSHQSYRASVRCTPLCCCDVNGNLSEEEWDELEAKMPGPLTDDDVECTGRVVTELVEADGQASALPDRFLMAMRAIRGEFSEGIDPTADTEFAEDSLLDALTTWPAAVKLRIVSRKLAADEAVQLVSDVQALGGSVDGSSLEVDVTERGERRAIDVRLSAVPDAATLSVLRSALKGDDRVQMVF